MNEFLAMGGYARFVWPAMGVFLAVLAFDWIITAVRRRRALRHVRILEDRRRQRARS